MPTTSLIIEKKTILLVEDDKDFLDIITLLLEDNGYSILQATNGQNALDVVNTKKGNIDLIITDCCMPIMDGLSMSYEIHKKYQDIPIILFSGDYPTHTSLKIIGIKEFVLKLSGTKKLLFAIEKLLKSNFA